MRSVYTITIFLSAALLFLIQPLFARMILPMLGGSPAVWNTAMVFYQSTLLAGYSYAHLTTRLLGPRRQAALHIGVMLLPLLALPIAVPTGWLPPTESSPVGWIMALLLVAVGLPYFVVSASSPLLQAWFSAVSPRGGNPYTLYVASNLGSMIGLLGYPFLVEPRLRLVEQSWLWSAGYLALLAMTAGCVVLLWRAPAATPGRSLAVAPPAPPLTWARRGRWVLLGFVPSSLLLSVTTYITTDLAAIPLLWVLPLALYLLTFSLVFAERSLLPHRLMVRALPIVLTPLFITIIAGATAPLQLLLPLHMAGFFVVAMVCHGELAADRPHPRYLTEFYLLMSLGGALGGSFNALLAPLIFTRVLEYPLALVLAGLLLPAALVASGPPVRRLDLALPVGLLALTVILISGGQRAGLNGQAGIAVMLGVPTVVCFSFSRRPLRFGLGLAALLLASTLFDSGNGRQLYVERTFFGLHRVLSRDDGFHYLAHGSTRHGLQSLDPARRHEPLGYYTRSGPLGEIFGALDERAGLRVAGVGMGTATIACYARPDQDWAFYEIDPAVVRIASDISLFSYLSDCAPTAQIVLGDARLALDKSVAQYDLLILDAYSSDAIPLHLITREALALYSERLAPGGLLAFHISNRYLDLEPVLARLAQDAGFEALMRSDLAVTPEEAAMGKWQSNWLLMARPGDMPPTLINSPRWRTVQAHPDTPLWSDDFASLLSALKH